MADKLTKKERAWVDEVNAVLARCPSDRLAFYTGGDPSVGIYLKKHQEYILDQQGDLVRILSAKGWLITETIDFPTDVEAVCI